VALLAIAVVAVGVADVVEVDSIDGGLGRHLDHRIDFEPEVALIGRAKPVPLLAIL
jgi:hypothetical protein